MRKTARQINDFVDDVKEVCGGYCAVEILDNKIIVETVDDFESDVYAEIDSHRFKLLSTDYYETREAQHIIFEVAR